MTTATRYMTNVTKWTTLAGATVATMIGTMIGIGWLVFQVMVYMVQG